MAQNTETTVNKNTKKTKPKAKLTNKFNNGS